MTFLRFRQVMPPDIVKSLAYLGHILCISLAYLGYIMGMSWANVGDILSISWPYLGHVMGICLAYLGHILAQAQALNRAPKIRNNFLCA